MPLMIAHSGETGVRWERESNSGRRECTGAVYQHINPKAADAVKKCFLIPFVSVY